jgi:pimeloyl-ACP methyl ester carboxylesterase
MWRRHRDRIAGLVLADTRAAADTPEAAQERSITIQSISERGMAVLAKSMPGKLVSGSAPQTLVHQIRDLIARQPVEGAVAALGAMAGRLDATGDLQGIDVPTMVMVGARDVVTSPEEVEAMAEAIPGSSFVVVPSAGHLPNLEEPGAFNAEMRAYLQALDGVPDPGGNA